MAQSNAEEHNKRVHSEHSRNGVTSFTAAAGSLLLLFANEYKPIRASSYTTKKCHRRRRRRRHMHSQTMSCRHHRARHDQNGLRSELLRRKAVGLCYFHNDLFPSCKPSSGESKEHSTTVSACQSQRFAVSKQINSD